MAGRNRLVAGTISVAMISATLPMGGCEPATAAAATTVVVVTMQQFAKWAAQAFVTWAVIEIADEIYVKVRDAITGEPVMHQVQPGDVLQMNEDGTFTVIR